MTADSLQNRLVQPGQLRRLGRAAERRAIPGPEISYSGEDDSGLDEPPFGWLPPA
jgi:hypothetical protein